MRNLVVVLLTLMALPVAAGEGFELGLAEMDFSARDETDVAPLVAGIGTDDVDGADRSERLVYRAAMTPRDPSERTLALWDSDLGRVRWALAEQEAMLGRQGLVHGGRMVGLGLATTTLGDGDPNALALALGRGNWAEMNANQKLQAGVEASILAALIYFIVANAD
ncbi:MAG TPA: hypothetical protein VLT32_15260 [Candidatus Sulfomarinibacteraceae bacterium]|nr:hypothetical protein [Candidatus Sulfomarinibacteraceae bacterium]